MSKSGLARVLDSLVRRLDSLEARARTTEASAEGMLISSLEAALHTADHERLGELLASPSARIMAIAVDAPRWRHVFERLAALGLVDDLLDLLARASAPPPAELVIDLYEACEHDSRFRAFMFGMRAVDSSRYEALAAFTRRSKQQSSTRHRARGRSQATRTRTLVADFVANTYTLDRHMKELADARSLSQLVADYARWLAPAPEQRRLGAAALRKALEALPDEYTFKSGFGGERLYRLRARDDDSSSSSSSSSDSEPIVSHYEDVGELSESNSLDDFIVDDERPRTAPKRRRPNPFIDDEADDE